MSLEGLGVGFDGGSGGVVVLDLTGAAGGGVPGVAGVAGGVVGGVLGVLQGWFGDGRFLGWRLVVCDAGCGVGWVW